MHVRRRWSWGAWTFSVLLSITVVWQAWAANDAIKHNQVEILRQSVRASIYRDLTNYAGIAVIVIDADGRVIEWNPGATALFGWDDADVLGSRLDFLLPRNVYSQHVDSVTQANAGLKGEVSTIESWVRRKDQQLVYVKGWIRTGRGTSIYHMALMLKVTPPGVKDAEPTPAPSKAAVEPLTPKPVRSTANIAQVFLEYLQEKGQ